MCFVCSVDRNGGSVKANLTYGLNEWGFYLQTAARMSVQVMMTWSDLLMICHARIRSGDDLFGTDGGS